VVVGHHNHRDRKICEIPDSKRETVITDSHALERDTMRTQEGGASGGGFIGVSIPRGLQVNLT